VNKVKAKGAQGEPPDKLPPPTDANDDGADDAVPADVEDNGQNYPETNPSINLPKP